VDTAASAKPKKAKKPTESDDEEDDDSFQTVGKDDRRMQFTPESIFKNLQIVQDARGKKVRDSEFISIVHSIV
jgi:translation initiation factor 3 subunit C